MMKRVLIVGCPGSGKTTLAGKVAAMLGVPAVHLDQMFWLPGWVEPDREAFDFALDQKLKEPGWVMDGNYTRTFARRISYADTVIYLDFNRFVCSWRALWRWIVDKGEQAPGCPQKVDREFLRYILLRYPRRHRPAMLEVIEAHKDQLQVVRLKSPTALRHWLSSFENVAKNRGRIAG